MQTIKNFLVGVGLDTTDWDKGSKEVTDDLGAIRGLAGIAGAALVGAFAAAASQAINASKRIDEFTLSTERMSASSGFVYNFGNALRLAGGDAKEAAAAVTAFESAIDQLQMGKSPFDNLSLAGIDTSALLRATDGADMARILAEIVPTLSKTQQRVVQEDFGLSDATMRVLRSGREQFDSLLSSAGSLTGELRGATEAARAYNKEVAELQLRFEGIGNTLAEKMLPSMTGVLKSLGEFIDQNRPKIDAAANLLSENPAATSLASSSAGIVAGGGIASKLGLKAAGGAAMRLGLPGVLIGTGALAWDMDPDKIEGLTGYRPSDYIFNNTPADAARDAYNWGAGKVGLDPLSKPETTSEQDVNSQFRLFEDGVRAKLRDRMNSGVVTGADSFPQITTNSSSDTKSLVERSAPMPKIQNDIALKIELDGRAIEHKVTEVVERRGQATIDDIQSTTVR